MAHSSSTSISSKLKERRNKLIRIAEKSEAKWVTIEEYQNDSAANDSENLRKICLSKQRALREQKPKSLVHPKPSFSFPESVVSQHFCNASFIHGYTLQLNIQFRRGNVWLIQPNTHSHPSNAKNHQHLHGSNRPLEEMVSKRQIVKQKWQLKLIQLVFLALTT